MTLIRYNIPTFSKHWIALLRPLFVTSSRRCKDFRFFILFLCPLPEYVTIQCFPKSMMILSHFLMTCLFDLFAEFFVYDH